MIYAALWIVSTVIVVTVSLAGLLIALRILAGMLASLSQFRLHMLLPFFTGLLGVIALLAVLAGTFALIEAGHATLGGMLAAVPLVGLIALKVRR